MATTPSTPLSKDEIIKGFRSLLAQFKREQARITTKEEAAEKERNREIVESAADYTVENIVKGLADLQLYFEDVIEKNTEKLEGESEKLTALRKAIVVENERIARLRSIRTAADALYILKKEHEEAVKALDAEISEARASLNESITETREGWAEEKKEFEAATKEFEERQAKERQQEEERFQYELERERKISADKFEEDKHLLERKLTEEEEGKDKDWAAREATLEEESEIFEENKAEVEAFPEKLAAETKKARDEAIKDTLKDADNHAKLLEAQVDGNKRVYELRIQTLDETLAKQTAQIERLETQAQEARVNFEQRADQAIAKGK